MRKEVRYGQNHAHHRAAAYALWITAAFVAISLGAAYFYYRSGGRLGGWWVVGVAVAGLAASALRIAVLRRKMGFVSLDTWVWTLGSILLFGITLPVLFLKGNDHLGQFFLFSGIAAWIASFILRRRRRNSGRAVL